MQMETAQRHVPWYLLLQEDISWPGPLCSALTGIFMWQEQYFQVENLFRAIFHRMDWLGKIIQFTKWDGFWKVAMPIESHMSMRVPVQQRQHSLEELSLLQNEIQQGQEAYQESWSGQGPARPSHVLLSLQCLFLIILCCGSILLYAVNMHSSPWSRKKLIGQ